MEPRNRFGFSRRSRSRVSRSHPAGNRANDVGLLRGAGHRPRSRIATMPEGSQHRDDGDDGVPRWLRKAGGVSWRLLAVVAVVVLFVYATSKITLVFIAVFIALVVTSVLRPLVKFYDRVMPRSLATGLAMLTGFIIVGGLLTYVVTSVTGQWSTLADQFTSGISDMLSGLEHLPLGLGISPEQLHQWTSPEQLGQWRDEGLKWLQRNQGNILSTAASQAGSIVEVFAALALSFFVTIFFLARGSELWQWFVNQLPGRVRPNWILGAEAGWSTFSGYARGTVLIALTDGVLAGITLVILGVPLAMPLAVLVFIGAFIPLVGAPAAMIIAMIVALATKGWVTAILVGIAIALIGQFEGHVLQPLVMGRQVSLHPVVVAVAVTAGTLVAGILGAVVVIPLVAVVWSVYSQLHDPDPPTPPEAFVAAHQRVRARRHRSKD